MQMTILALMTLLNNNVNNVNNVNDGLIKSLEEASKAFFKCFDDNLMKSNPGKCHLLFSTNDNVSIKIGNLQIQKILKGKNSWVYSLKTSCLFIIIYQKYAKKLAENFML